MGEEELAVNILARGGGETLHNLRERKKDIERRGKTP